MTARQRRGEGEEDGEEKKSRTEKNGRKTRSDKVTDGSPDSERNHPHHSGASDAAAATGVLQQWGSPLPLGQILELVESRNLR